MASHVLDARAAPWQHGSLRRHSEGAAVLAVKPLLALQLLISNWPQQVSGPVLESLWA